jgi:hypothetical protein
MLRRLLVASAAVAAISAFTFVSQPVEAGSCTVLAEKAVGLKQSETSTRALKQLNRKANHWAKKNGYKSPRISKLSMTCTKKGAIYHCTATAKVCG